MVKWNLFKRLIPEKEDIPSKETVRIIDNEEEIKEDNKPLAEYKETLYTSNKSSIKSTSTYSSTGDRYWRNVDAIEKKIDKLNKTQVKKPTTEVDKKVDKIIQKRMRK